MASASTERGRRTLRRVVMWVVMWGALVMAMGIGVVWAGGGWTRFSWVQTHPPIRTFADMKPLLYMQGTLGRVDFGRRLNVLRLWYSSHGGPVIQPTPPTPSTWLPSFDGAAWDEWVLRVPYWIPTLLCLGTFALLFRLERRATRLARAGMCASCGYDRAGLSSGVVCPECGRGRGSLPSGRRPGRS